MLNSERLAIAAHLHVLLRRKSGRVTDTEWMACNTDYAAEIIRFARAKAHEEEHADLAEWAAKLEVAMAALTPPPAPAPRPISVKTTEAKTPTPREKSATPDAESGSSRYVWGVR